MLLKYLNSSEFSFPFKKPFYIFIFSAFVIEYCLPALGKKLFKDYLFTKSHTDISVFLSGGEGYCVFALLYQQNHKPAAVIKAE